jgi:flagellar protein FlbD
MIQVTRLNGTKITLNALLIETVEETPDTIIALTTGKKFVVTESAAEIAGLVADFLKQAGSIKVTMLNNIPEG